MRTHGRMPPFSARDTFGDGMAGSMRPFTGEVSVSLLANILLEEDEEAPTPQADELAWIRGDWVPRVSSLLARLAPGRPVEGSPDEASAIRELRFVLVEPLGRVSRPWWLIHLRGTFRHVIEDSVRREFQDIEVERKLALRFIQMAADNVGGVFDDVFRETPMGLDGADEVASAMSKPFDAEAVAVLRPMVSLIDRDGARRRRAGGPHLLGSTCLSFLQDPGRDDQRQRGPSRGGGIPGVEDTTG